MILKKKICAAVTVAALLSYASAGAAELSIGPVRLILGAEQNAIMPDIRAHFTVLPMEDNPNHIFLKENGSLTGGKIIGEILFDNGHLVGISRDWGSFEEKVNSVVVGNALFAAIESASTPSGASAKISIETQRLPGIESKCIKFKFPDHLVQVSILVYDEGQGQKVQISESIGRWEVHAPKAPPR